MVREFGFHELYDGTQSADGGCRRRRESGVNVGIEVITFVMTSDGSFTHLMEVKTELSPVCFAFVGHRPRITQDI
jgi:hypothetical protein